MDMRNRIIIIMLTIFSCVMLMCSCTRNSINVVYNFNMDFTSEELPSGLSEYDSTVFSDGSVAVYRCGYSPLNSAMDMKDAYGRLLATYSSASETSGQYLVYDYDESGVIKRIIEFGDESDDLHEIQLWMSRHDDYYYLDVHKLRNRIERLDEIDFSSDFYNVYEFFYDEDGNIESVYENGCVSVEADGGCKLVYETVPCPSFWESDINGGHYYINIKQIVGKSGMKNYIERKYQHMILQHETDYVYSKPVQMRLYNTNGQYIKTVFATIDSGMNVYTHFYAGLPERKVEYWKEGKKLKEETVSIYGTVLVRKNYSYLSNGDVSVTKYTIDFDNRKMNQKSVYLVKRDEMHDEYFIMDGEQNWQYIVDGHSIVETE